MAEANYGNGQGSQILFVVLGVLVNILLGGVLFYITELRNDVKTFSDLARANSANIGLLARDFDHSIKWNTEQVLDLKRRVTRIEGLRNGR